MDVEKILTAEDLLITLRKGNSQKLEIGLGEFKVPCRLLNASEEARLMAKASTIAMKENPQGIKKEMWESLSVMKLMLKESTTISGAGLPDRFWEMLTQKELTELFDQYVSLNHTINPSVQELNPEQISEIVEQVKKKGQASVSALYMWQLAEIGKLFLMNVAKSQTDSGSGI